MEYFHLLNVQKDIDIYLSSINVVQDKVELVCGLEGVVEADQERVLHVL